MNVRNPYCVFLFSYTYFVAVTRNSQSLPLRVLFSLLGMLFCLAFCDWCFPLL